MKRIFKFCLSFIVAIGLAFSVVGCSVLDGLNERESAAKNNADESGPTAEYEGNKVNQSNYNGVTYLEEDFDYKTQKILKSQPKTAHWLCLMCLLKYCFRKSS